MINANEQRIIDVAGGTFEYQGELYTAHPSYLNILENKLNEEKYDLTDEEASQVIQKIFANIEQGVKQGILKKVTGEKAKEAREKGEVHSLSEIGVSGEEESSREESGEGTQTTGGKNQGETAQEKQEMVTGKDGKSYPVQQEPLQMNALTNLHPDEVKETLQEYTPNPQVASQLNANTGQMGITMLISLAVCIAALSIYLKVFKHRHKAFLVMLGAGLASLSILLLGSIYIYNVRAYSPDTWQTVALESGYFKECTKSAQEKLQKVLTDVKLEAGVGVLNLNEDAVYRDARSVFSACLAGEELPKLKKREEEVQETLREILPKESVQNVETLSNTLMEHYRQVLQTPYATYLYETSQKEKTRNMILSVVSIFVLLISMLLIWVGCKYIHRRFRGLSYAIGMAGVSFIVSSIIDTVMKKDLSIEPKIYQSLFEKYLEWRSENVLYFGLLLLCISIFTWGAAYVTKKNHIEKLGLK